MKQAPISAIVVPCFNEAARLPADTFRHFAGLSGDRIFIFVDDGSTDGTELVVAELCRDDPHHFRLLTLDRNLGKGEAVRHGLLHAARLDAQYIGFWDADLSTPLDVLPQFEDTLESKPHVRVVMGARVRLLGRGIQRRAVRHYLGRVFATGASLALGLPVYDTQCGAKLFRNDTAFELLLREPFRSRWIFDVELLARMVEADGSRAVQDQVYELPLVEWRDVRGSKLSPWAFWRAGLELLTLYVRLRPRRRNLGG